MIHPHKTARKTHLLVQTPINNSDKNNRKRIERNVSEDREDFFSTIRPLFSLIPYSLARKIVPFAFPVARFSKMFSALPFASKSGIP